MYFSLDRFEGNKAVLMAEKEIKEVAKNKLPKGTKEGDILFFDGDNFFKSEEETQKKRDEVSKTLQLLLKKEKDF